MRKKLTLWGALCLIMVCMIQMTVSAATTVTISQCIISGANQVTVTANASATTPSDDNNYYLFSLQPYENAIGSRTDFCAQTAKASALTFVTTLDQGTAASKLYAKFVVAVKTGGSYVAVSPEFYITNPEAVATKTQQILWLHPLRVLLQIMQQSWIWPIWEYSMQAMKLL